MRVGFDTIFVGLELNIESYFNALKRNIVEIEYEKVIVPTSTKKSRVVCQH